MIQKARTKQVILSLVFTLGLISSPVFSESFSGGQPASPQPDSAKMKPGLWVMYFYDFYDHIDQVSELNDGGVGDPRIALRSDI